jgi:hypothetical protein
VVLVLTTLAVVVVELMAVALLGQVELEAVLMELLGRWQE